MSSLIRIFVIFWIISRYRLNRLIPAQSLAWYFRILLWFFELAPKTNGNRGQRLRFAFESLGPIFIKFGQLLSTRPDLIPPDIIEELNELQDNVTPFEPALFRKIVEKALNDTIENIFDDFSENPLASASVAQVHTAKLKTGEKVVVKAVRPNIEKTIEKDTKLLRLIAELIEKVSSEGRRFRMIDIVEDYRSTILDELNLAKEAANASQLRRNFENDSNLYIPEVFWDYSNQHVLTLEYIDGIQVNDRAALEAQDTNFELLAKRGVEVFFTQVFEHNFFHADMHPGNVFISKVTPENPSYMAVDFAIVGSLTQEDQYYLARNMLAMFRRDYRQVAELHILSGWVPENTSISGFESAIRAVCEPIFEKPLKEISFGEALITLFQTARRFNMPVQPQLVLLQKTLLNIEGLGRQLYPDLDLWQTAHPFLEEWIKKRYHPKTLWKQFKYHSPDWLEKFPQLPQLVFESISEVKNLAEIAPELKRASQIMNKSKQTPRSGLKALVPFAAFTSAGVIAWPSLAVLPVESILLGSIGVISLILR